MNGEEPPADDRWVSGYLFLQRSFDPFLTGVVHPVQRRLRSEGTARRFFFLRYALLGVRHLRLRFERSDSTSASRLREELAEPVVGRADARIVFTDYEPEYEKFGGRGDMAPFHRHFEHSSLLAIQCLSHLDGGSCRIHARRGLAGRLLLAYPWEGSAPRPVFLSRLLETYVAWWLKRLPAEDRKAARACFSVPGHRLSLYPDGGDRGSRGGLADPPPETLLVPWREMWGDAEDEALAGDSLVRRVGLIHLFMNRLGLQPLEELMLASACLEEIGEARDSEEST